MINDESSGWLLQGNVLEINETERNGFCQFFFSACSLVCRTKPSLCNVNIILFPAVVSDSAQKPAEVEMFHQTKDENKLVSN